MQRSSYAWRYWEGPNRLVGALITFVTAAVLWRYPRAYALVHPLSIDPDILLSYTFNLYAISLGALVSLFALLASRPTEFLVRIRGTATFARLISHIKITMAFCSLVILVNFIFGVLKLVPEPTLTIGTAVFVIWCGLAASTAAFFVNTTRLIFLALT